MIFASDMGKCHQIIKTMQVCEDNIDPELTDYYVEFIDGSHNYFLLKMDSDSFKSSPSGGRSMVPIVKHIIP